MFGPDNEAIAYYMRGRLLRFIPITWEWALDSCRTREEILEMVKANPQMFATKEEVAQALVGAGA